MKIVVIEDTSSIRRVMERALSSFAGHEVLAFESAEEGLIHIDAETELVVTDWDLPRGMSGPELIEKLRSGRLVPQGATMPIILISGREESEVRAAAERVGASMYLLKPFFPSTDVLIEAVQRFAH